MPIAFADGQVCPFPEYSPEHDEYGGLVCVSEDITPEMILQAYRRGIFPWHRDENWVYWYSQNPRAVLLPENLHIPRSLQKTLRNKLYRITANCSFPEVIAACAATPRAGQNGTWITPDFQAAYTALHHLEHAHSFECWLPENGGWTLAGGFYGVQIGSVFYGESMFAARPDASKTAFAYAVPYLARCGIRLIDCQQDTAHLARFGSQLLPFSEFRTRLQTLNVQPLHQEIGRNIIIAEN